MSNNIHLSEEELANFHKMVISAQLPFILRKKWRKFGVPFVGNYQIVRMLLTLQTRTVRQRIYRITIAILISINLANMSLIPKLWHRYLISLAMMFYAGVRSSFLNTPVMKVLTGIRLIHLLTPVENRKFFGPEKLKISLEKGL